MNKRDKYIARMKKQLDKWDKELDELEVKAGKAKENARAKYDEKIKLLRVKRDKMKEEMNNILDAGEDAWEDVRDKTSDVWSALKGGFAKAADVFRKDEKKKPSGTKKAASKKTKAKTPKAPAAKSTTVKKPVKKK